MKIVFSISSSVAILVLSGCRAPERIAVAPAATPATVATSRPVPTPTPAPAAPAATPRIVQSRRSSLPALPQMMDPSIPRPTFIPLPTPTPRPTPVVMPTPTPRQNQTLIVSNAPLSATEIAPQDAAARELVWVNTDSQTYHRAGSRFYGATQNGYYVTESQARSRGYRAALR